MIIQLLSAVLVVHSINLFSHLFSVILFTSTECNTVLQAGHFYKFDTDAMGVHSLVAIALLPRS